MTDRYQVRTPTVVHEVFEDEVVIVDLDSGDYYSLSDAGVTCWNCLLSGCTVRETVDFLESRYEGSIEEIETAVRTLFVELEEAGLIVRGGASGSRGVSLDVTAGGGDAQKFVTPVLSRYSDMRDLLLIDPIHEVDEGGWPQVRKESDDKVD